MSAMQKQCFYEAACRVIALKHAGERIDPEALKWARRVVDDVLTWLGSVSAVSGVSGSPPAQ